MKIQLIDRNLGMTEAWQKEFKGCEDVVIYRGDFFSQPTDCMVSPANSFGFMDGGLDAALTRYFGVAVEQRVQKMIKDQPLRELLVGEALLVPTDHLNVPYLICAPTMRVPQILTNTVNVYLASKAVFSVLQKMKKLGPFGPKLNSITISGLGTGVGRVLYDVCARQMKQAYDEIWLEQYHPPATWMHAQKHHQLLYTNQTRDLQL